MSLSTPGMLKDMRLKPNCSGGPQCVPPRIWNLGSSQCPPRPPWPHTLRGPAYRGGWQPCVRKPQGRSLWWDDTHPQVSIVVHIDLVLKESFADMELSMWSGRVDIPISLLQTLHITRWVVFASNCFESTFYRFQVIYHDSHVSLHPDWQV